MRLSRSVVIAVIKFFCHGPFEKKFTITMTEVVLIHLFSLTGVSKSKISTEYRGTFISFKSYLQLKQGSPIFILFGLWIAVFISMFGLSQSLSNNSNLIILVDIQHLHENDKWILCVSNGFFFLRCFLAAPHCFINYFIHSRVKASQILYGETTLVTPNKNSTRSHTQNLCPT